MWLAADVFADPWHFSRAHGLQIVPRFPLEAFAVGIRPAPIDLHGGRAFEPLDQSRPVGQGMGGEEHVHVRLNQAEFEDAGSLLDRDGSEQPTQKGGNPCGNQRSPVLRSPYEMVVGRWRMPWNKAARRGERHRKIACGIRKTGVRG